MYNTGSISSLMVTVKLLPKFDKVFFLVFHDEIKQWGSKPKLHLLHLQKIQYSKPKQKKPHCRNKYTQTVVEVKTIQTYQD